MVAASWVIAGMGAMASAGLLEDLAHDSHMRGLGCGPHRARDEVVLLHEGGEQQRVVPAHSLKRVRSQSRAANAAGECGSRSIFRVLIR
jgi:hypothetical protein